MAKGDEQNRQVVRGDGAVGVQVDGDRNTVTIFAGGTRLVLKQKHQHRGNRAPKDERELLMTEWRATALVGRSRELESLAAWCDDPAPVAVRCITGKAGAGKTRLAIEACDAAEASGWDSGFVSGEELARFHAAENLAAWHSAGPVLVVVDDAAVSTAMLKKWLDTLAGGRPAGAGKLRILLLERHAEADGEHGWWATLKRPDTRDGPCASDLIGDVRPEPLAMLAAPEERRALFSEAMRIAGQLPGKSALVPPALGEDATFDRLIGDDRMENEPLFLMMAAIVAVDRGARNALALSKIALAEGIAIQERARLARLAASRGLDPDGDLIAHLAACATLQRGCSFAAARTMAAEEIVALGFASPLSASKLADLLGEALPSVDGAGIDRIRPDLIGEAFALREFHRARVLVDEERFAIIERARRREEAGVLESLILAAQDLSDGSAGHPAVRWLAAISERSDNPEELMRIEGALPQNTLALRELSARLTERIVGKVRKMGSGNVRLLLPRYLLSHGFRLSALGLREEALAAEQEAIDILRGDTGAESRPALALSLTNVSVSLTELGRREEALAASEEAVSLRRALAEAEPDTFTGGLALSLNNLAGQLAAVGRHREALTAGEEAVTLRRALAAARPDAFTSDLAVSLHNLANRWSELGRPEEALAAGQEAVALRRTLAAAWPDAHTPDLASSLHNLARQLSSLKRKDEALAVGQEAVAIHRVLALARPEAFTPSLATSLNNLASQLAALERYEEARVMGEEAILLRRALAAVRPDVFTHDLATSLGALGSISERQGEPIKAAEYFHEAAARLTPQFVAIPAAFAALMSNILRDYLRCAQAAEVELDWEILAPIVAVFEQLRKDEENGD